MREVWEDFYDCRNVVSCMQKPLDMSRFQIDTKTDFVIDAVLALSDALERCVGEQHESSCVPKSQEFFDKYIKTVNLQGEHMHKDKRVYLAKEKRAKTEKEYYE